MDEAEGRKKARANGHITVYKNGEKKEEERYCIMCGLAEGLCAFSICDRSKCPPLGE
jgi:hypothetical protein